jgi:hypothetical protein
MKPKQQIDHNAAGDEAKRLLAEDGTANAVLKDLRTAKATRKEQLKAALTVVWSALEAGTAVNGFSTKEEWCKEFAKVTIRTAQHIIFGRKKDDERTDVRLDITAQIANVEFNAQEAHCLVDFEQKRELKYQGARRSGNDFSFGTDNNNPTEEEYEALVKVDKVVWTHTAMDVSGHVIVTVENEDGTTTEKELVAALRTKVTATIKAMRLWNKCLTKDFNALVKDSADWHEEKSERHSRSAKNGALTRKKNSKDEGLQFVKGMLEKNKDGQAKKQKKVKTVDPNKDLMMRFRAAKRLA